MEFPARAYRIAGPKGLLPTLRAALLSVSLTLIAVPEPAFAWQNETIPQDVAQSVRARVDGGRNVAIVVGVVDPDGFRYYSYGSTAVDAESKADENTLFEIGSITKVFTSVLLAELSLEGMVALDDPVQAYLPDSVHVPTRGGKEITLALLATHMSGLPRLPNNMAPADVSNPYADYTLRQMYAFLSSYELPRDIGASFEYSNLAVGLLGHALARLVGTDYETLVRRRILDELAMESTGISLSPDQKQHLATGHNQGRKVQNWDIPTLAGAGALRSTAHDLLLFLAANMGLDSDSIGGSTGDGRASGRKASAAGPRSAARDSLLQAMRLTHRVRVDRKANGMSIGLGWHIRHADDVETIWHGGGTGGYRSFAGFNRGGTTGVVVLTNSIAGVDDIGFHLLDPTYPLQSVLPNLASRLRLAIDSAGAPAAAEAYRRAVEAGPSRIDFNHLAILNLGDVYLDLERNADAAAVFEVYTEREPDRAAGHEKLAVAYERLGRPQDAVREYSQALRLRPGNETVRERLAALGIDPDSAAPAVVVPASVLESYVGEYSVTPAFTVTITLEGSQLMAQATGQAKYPIYPASKTRFFWKVVDAEVTFNRDDKGRVVSLTMLQAGQTVPGLKVK